MPTVSKKIADDVIAGKYSDDAPVYSIVQYINAWGNAAYGLNYSTANSYVESSYVIDPIPYWINPAYEAEVRL